MAYLKIDLRVTSPIFSSRVLCTVFALALAACAASADQAHAGGTPPGLKGKPLPIYAAKSTDCYVLLKDQSPYITSSDAPVCVAVLSNFNKFCDEPPQYNRRKIHFSSKDLTEPKWEAMDAKANADLVKQTYMSHLRAQFRESSWKDQRESILALASAGRLHLLHAEISADLRGGRQTVYRLEKNAFPPEPPGFDQPYLMFADRGAQSPAPLFRLYSASVADLWSFQDTWYLLRFWPADNPQDRRFLVYELISSRASPNAPVVPSERCTLQHKSDHQGVNAP